MRRPSRAKVSCGSRLAALFGQRPWLQARAKGGRGRGGVARPRRDGKRLAAPQDQLHATPGLGMLAGTRCSLSSWSACALVLSRAGAPSGRSRARCAGRRPRLQGDEGLFALLQAAAAVLQGSGEGSGQSAAEGEHSRTDAREEVEGLKEATARARPLYAQLGLASLRRRSAAAAGAAAAATTQRAPWLHQWMGRAWWSWTRAPPAACRQLSAT